MCFSKINKYCKDEGNVTEHITPFKLTIGTRVYVVGRMSCDVLIWTRTRARYI